VKLAGLSVDVDSVACHLEGYGFERPTDSGEAYEIAVPRALDLFDRIGARATFFLIAEEASRWPAVVREIAGRGHEVASHSLTHSVPFGKAGPVSLQDEVRRSKRLLEDLSGGPVVGFRAPSWEGSAELRRELAADGYAYDASAFPSILLPALRWSVARRSPSARKVDVPGMVRGIFGRAEPYIEQTAEGPMAVIPLATTPVLRFPYYHTMKFLLRPSVFALIEAATLRHRITPTYVMHAVDFLDVQVDGLDPRISRHPGMSLELDAKLAAAEEAVTGLASGRSVIPLAEIARHAREE
jgi:peptidoglycan/xylan/chitin deacetylase (PgdA/CDA1 family)